MNSLTATLANEEHKLLACIHCGLCLEACPTYVVTGDENDGPRGRLYLMRAVSEGRLSSISATFERHIDRCLGCRACESVCPAGVEYGDLLEASRGELFSSSAQRGLVYTLLRIVLRHIWLQPRRLKLAFALARFIRDARIARFLLKTKLPKLLSSRFEFGLALLESSRESSLLAESHKLKNTKQTAEPASALIFRGCVTEGLFARVNEATSRVLGVNGYTTLTPDNQVCCGALHAHAGDLEGARRLARQNITAFSDYDTPIVTNAGGCGAMLLSYPHLLADDEPFAEAARKFSARIRDVSQQLDSADIKQGAPIGKERVTYDASCHLLYGQRAGDAPLRILGRMSDLNFVPLAGAERCCGGAGVYNLMEREMSQTVLDEKLAAITASGADLLVTGNAGCQMQIGAGALLCGLPLQLCHPVELLDESYRRAGFYGESEEAH
ncbi:MAG TPA: heterodisulfide reductase-related iron-sulfur binding cluster [Pyrinomonadaceae bacterium]|nr:heterodisulfide reductase-related iron-sulfur binding cluster [Pyrinomonadaceae bacterium]